MAASGDAPTEEAPVDVDEAEGALWAAMKAGASARARESLFNFHFAFARQIAARHYLDRKSGDIEFADLCQLASAGLLEALDKYDPGRGVPFRPFARRRISGSVLDGIAKISEVREQISFRQRMRRERVRSLSVSEPDTLSPADALQALIELATGLAVGFMLEGTGAFVVEGQPANQPTAYEGLAWKETVNRMMAELSDLPDREQSIVRYHYIEGLSFEQIGDLYALSKGRISQLHRSALSHLREALLTRPGFRLEK